MLKSVTFFYRHPDAGFSIQKVFIPIVRHFKKQCEVQTLTMPKHDASFRGVLRNILYTFKNRNKQGINHITGDIHYLSLGLIGCKSVVTIHDTNYTDSMHNALKRWGFQLLYYRLAFAATDRIVCISTKTQKSIKRFTRKKTSVIPDPIDTTIFHPSPKTFNAACPTILIVGTAWNKNVPLQIRALENIPCKVRIIGSLSPEIQEALDAAHTIYENRFNLTDEEIYEEYKNCDIVSFCSLCEGFGMPVVEGQITGRPILSSAIEPIVEVAGKGACLVNPHKMEEVRDGFVRIINDENYRNGIVSAGLENAKRFYPERICQAYEQIYASL